MPSNITFHKWRANTMVGSSRRPPSNAPAFDGRRAPLDGVSSENHKQEKIFRGAEDQLRAVGSRRNSSWQSSCVSSCIRSIRFALKLASGLLDPAYTSSEPLTVRKQSLQLLLAYSTRIQSPKCSCTMLCSLSPPSRRILSPAM